MRLLRVGDPGHEKPAIQDREGGIRDLSTVIGDVAGAALESAGLEQLRQLDLSSLPLVPSDVRVGPPVGRVGKFIGIGLNYRDHAEETGMPIPEQPIVFVKASSCLSGPTDDVVLPEDATRGDFEVELAVVIGSRAKRVSEEEALDYVAGYAICNDISERGWQAGGQGEWFKAKSYDSWGPLGPWLVTTDEVPDPQALDLTLDLNGQRMQTGTTATMIFPVRTLISYISRYMTLLPGDVISTGTPPGVGMARKPRVFLKPGDEMVLTVTGLGEQHLKVVAER